MLYKILKKDSQTGARAESRAGKVKMTNTLNTKATKEAMNKGNAVTHGFISLVKEAPKGSEAIEALRREVVADFFKRKPVYPFNMRTLSMLLTREAYADFFHTSRGVIGGYTGNWYRAYEKALNVHDGTLTRAEALEVAKPFARSLATIPFIGTDNAEYFAPILNDSALRSLMKEHVRTDAKHTLATADVKHFANEVAKAVMLKLYAVNYVYTYYDTTATATEKANAEKDAKRAEAKKITEAKKRAEAEKKRAEAKKRAESKKVSEAKKNGTALKDGKTLLKVQVTA